MAQDVVTARPCECLMFDLPGQPICGEPAVARVATGCVHEHIEEDWMCVRHVALAKENTLICSACRTGPVDHSCQAYALAETDTAGARTILVGAVAAREG